MNAREPDSSVDVWSMELSAADLVESAAAILSPDEQERAARFRFGEVRNSFVLARAGLRSLVARYLDTSPEALRFSYDGYGKPALASPVSDLQFNLSHSGGLALYAFGRCGALGVDIEKIREMADAMDIARRFFSAAEFADLEGADAAERQHLFFNCWVRKEAFVKAVGQALSIPLDSFRVTFLPGQDPCVLDSTGAKNPEWRLHDLRIAAGYRAALVYRGGGHPVRTLPAGEAGKLLRSAVRG